MHFVRFLASLGTVDIAYASLPDGSVGGDPTFRHEFQLTAHSESRVATALLGGALARRPFPVLRFSKASRRQLVERVATEEYDYIVVRAGHTASLVLDLPPKFRSRVMIDLDDNIAGSLYDQMVGSDRAGFRGFVLNQNRRLLKAFESTCTRGNTVFVCTDADRIQRIRSSKRVVVVPNVYATDQETFAEVHDGFALDNRLLFLGTLSYPPNSEGLLWFVQNIFPALRDRDPSARLIVVGRNPPAAVEQMCSSTPGVELHADVPDVGPHYAASRAVVVPLLSGGGTRIKILEACLARRPVISTPLGAEGLALQHDRELLLFNDADEFLAAIARLKDPSTYRTMVASAQDAVQREYSTGRFAAILTDVVHSIDSAR